MQVHTTLGINITEPYTHTHTHTPHLVHVHTRMHTHILHYILGTQMKQ
jgi:hypothetical protein